MKSQIAPIVAWATLLVGGCTVNDSKKTPEVAEEEKKEEIGANITEPVEKSLEVKISFKDQNVYKSETLIIDWSSEDGASCALKANGVELAANLSFEGSITHAPDADTTYEMSCVKEGVTGLATEVFKPQPDEIVSIPIFDKADLSSIVDLLALSNEACEEGTPCFFMDLEPEFFKKTSNGWAETDKFIGALKALQNISPAPKAVQVDSTSASFDEASSVVYGSVEAVDKANFGKLCEEQSPIKADALLSPLMQFAGLSTNGFEELTNGIINVNLFSDLELTTSARRSLVTKNTAVDVTFKTAQIGGQISTNYEDYSTLSGSFELALSDRQKPRSLSTLPLSNTLPEDDVSFDNHRNLFAPVLFTFAYPPVPAGYRLPARGYGGDPNAFVPTDLICALSWQDVNYPMIGTMKYGPVSDYFPLMTSKRIVRGPGTLSCSKIDSASSRELGLGDEWTADVGDAWWFVSDGNWPSCGGYDCPGKNILLSMTTLWSEFEPVRNFCINRYQGLEDAFSAYYKTMLTACRNAEPYKKAIAARQESENNSAFRNACLANSACSRTVSALNWLAMFYNPQAVRRHVEETTRFMEANKQAGVSLIINSLAYESFYLNNAENYLSTVESNIRAIEDLRLTFNPAPKFSSIYASNLPANLVPPLSAIKEPDFASYEALQKTLLEYREIVRKMRELASLSVKKVNCSFESKGKFRKYTGVAVGDLEITTLVPQKKSLATLRDLKIQK